MNTTAPAATRHVEALVVEHDPGTRLQLVEALARRGYEVKTCRTLGEGRAVFQKQPLIVTHANGDTAELRHFVEYVRLQAGDAQPYILAVGEANSPSDAAQGRLGLDDYVTVPLEPKGLDERIGNIAVRLRHFPSKVAAAAVNPRPLHALADKAAPALLSHFCPVLLDHLPQALAMFDQDMRYLAANRRYLEAFGLESQPVIGRTHGEIFPGLHESWRALFDKARQGEAGCIEEDLFQRPGGGSDWVRWEITPWRGEEGEIGGVILSQEIITAQKKARRKARFEHHAAASLFSSATLPVLLVGLDGRLLRSSPAARAALGLQPTADGRLPFWEIYPDQEAEARAQEQFVLEAAGWREAKSVSFQPEDITIPGAPPQQLSWHSSAYHNAAGQTEAVLLTGCLRPGPPPPVLAAPEQAGTLSSQEAEAFAIVDQHLPLGFLVLDRAGVITLRSQSLAALLGRPAETGAPFEQWLAQGAAEEALREPLLREWRDNVWRRHITHVFSLRSAEGLLKEIEIQPRLLKDGRLLLTCSDATERSRDEEALRTSEAKYRGIFREFPVAIAVTDRTGSIIESNPALEKLCGFSRNDLRRLRLNELLIHGRSGDAAAAVSLKVRAGSPLPVTFSLGPITNSAGRMILQACLIQPHAPSAKAAPPEKPAASPAPSSIQPVTPFVPSALPTAAARIAPLADAAEPAPAPRPFSLLRPLPGFADLAPLPAAAEKAAPAPPEEEAILLTDLRGHVLEANDEALKVFGGTWEELSGTGLYQLFRPEDPRGFSSEVSRSINTQRRWQAQTTYFRSDSHTGRCHVEVTPLGGEKPGLRCVVRPLKTALPG